MWIRTWAAPRLISPLSRNPIFPLLGTPAIPRLTYGRFTAGNGAVQAVTTIAILSGILFYTVLFENLLADNFTSKEDVLQTVAPLAWLLVLGSVIEWFLASRLPFKMCFSSFRPAISI